jgi:hypothetical protein
MFQIASRTRTPWLLQLLALAVAACGGSSKTHPDLGGAGVVAEAGRSSGEAGSDRADAETGEGGASARDAERSGVSGSDGGATGTRRPSGGSGPTGSGGATPEPTDARGGTDSAGGPGLEAANAGAATVIPPPVPMSPSECQLVSGLWCEADASCVLGFQICDGVSNCSDGSDEPSDCQALCQATGSLWCAKDSRCLLEFQICDGVADCSDGSDEPNDCQARCEADGSVWCAEDSKCLYELQVCNGVADCSDGSDEPNDCQARCEANGSVWCAKDSKCLYEFQVCNGVADCSDGSDEPNDCQARCEADGSVWCAEDSKCLYEFQVCNGVADCSDGSDESSECEVRCEAGGSQLWCAADGTCITQGLMCNGISNCSDGSDEAGCTCFQGDQRCAGTVLETCGIDASTGKAAWQSVRECTLCSPQLGCLDCNPGDRSCDGLTPLLCSDQGTWSRQADCEQQACVDGTCVGECSPGTATCDGTTGSTCSDDGQWESETCDWGCIEGDGCATSADVCHSEKVCLSSYCSTTCDAFGFCSSTGTWGTVQVCEPRPCSEPEDCGSLGYCDTSVSAAPVCRARQYCSNTSCLNGGDCIQGDVSFTCKCAPGYSGATCATNIDDCAGSPCQNGGTCSDGINSYTCDCAAGFEGDNCEVNVDDCAVDSCNNGGVCEDRVNAVACCCPPGFAGPTCDSQETWTSFALATTLWGSNSVGALAVDPNDSRIIFASDDNGTTGDVVWRSEDGGQSWSEICPSVWGAMAIALDPTDAATVFLAPGYGASGIYKALLVAGTCTEVSLGGGYGIYSSVVRDQTLPSRLYAASARLATNTPAVYRSTNSGTSWTPVFDSVSVDALVLDPTDGMTVFALGMPDWGTFGTPDPTTAGAWRSTNAGDDWTKVIAGRGPVLALAIGHVDSSNVLASTTDSGMIRSTNGGTDWTLANTGLDGIIVNTIAIDPQDDSIAYAGPTDHGVYRSLDGGQTWTSFTDGMEQTTVNTILVDPSDPNTLYASTEELGVYRRRLPGAVGECSTGEEPDTGCDADEFSCGNGQCVPSYYRCDVFVDCSNGADESNCQ